MQKSAQTCLGVLMATLVVVSTAVAGPFEDAISAYDRGDNTTAMRLFRPLAEEGRADAQTRLGAMYDNGNGVAQDYAQAVVWFRKAAEQGDAEAQFNLSLHYADGQGVAQDDAQSVAWLRKAADQRYPDARFALEMLISGDERSTNTPPGVTEMRVPASRN